MNSTHVPKTARLLFPAILSLITLIGCKRDAATPPTLTSKDLVGQWRLVTAGGKPMENVHIKSYSLNLADDGTWTSKAHLTDRNDLTDNGTWTLNGTEINYTRGDKSGKVNVKLTDGHLTLDPDFILHEAGKKPISAEYER